MHAEAREFVAQHARPSPGQKVLDIGGQNMNGTVRDLFPGAEYLSMDIVDGPGVDIVADAREWRPGWPSHEGFDLVVCCEVFEHADGWPKIVRTAYEALRPGGRFVATMAGPARPPHSGRRALPDTLEPGEFYENVPLPRLLDVCETAGFVDIDGDTARDGEDVRVSAYRPVPVHVVTGIYGGYDTTIQGMAPQLHTFGQAPGLYPTFTLVCDEIPGGAGQAFKPGMIYPEAQHVVWDDLEPKHAARWPKFLPSQALPETVGHGDVVVWIDGRIEVVAEDFVSMVVDALGDGDFAAWRHPSVTTVAEQIAACINEQPHKYDRQDLVGHGSDRAGAGESIDGMWQLTILAQRVTDRTMAVGEDVMAAMAKWPRSIDQIEFAYAVRRHGARVADLPGGQGGFWSHVGDWFRIHPHRDGT